MSIGPTLTQSIDPVQIMPARPTVSCFPFWSRILASTMVCLWLSSFTLILMCMIVLKSIALSFCWMTLHMGLSSIISRPDQVMHSWQEYQRRNSLPFSERHIKRQTMSIHPTTNDVNFDHFIKLVSSPFSPFI